MNQISPMPPLGSGIIARVASLQSAWDNAPTGPTKADEEALRAYMATHFDAPAMELETMRPATVAEALAKVRFHIWCADAIGSDEPYERGLRIAADDLAALAGVPAAVNEGDPDAEIKQLWAAAVRLEHEFEHAPFSGTEEERDQQYQHMSDALDTAFAAEAHTVSGLAIKLQQFMKAWELNYGTDSQSELISTAYATAERLAPGSVVYRPNIPSPGSDAGVNENALDEAGDIFAEGKTAGLAGIPASENPHGSGNSEADIWERGRRIGACEVATSPIPSPIQTAFTRYPELNRDEAIPDEEEGPAIYAWRNQEREAWRVVATEPAHTVADIAVKVQLLVMELVDGESKHQPDIIRTLFAGLEELAPGCIKYEPPAQPVD